MTNASVKLQLLNGGSFTANYTVLHAGVPEQPFRMYNWAFYIFHPETGRHILWDLGLTSVMVPLEERSKLTLTVQDPNDYTPWVNKSMEPLNAVSPTHSISQQLLRNGINSEQVDEVIFRSVLYIRT